MTSISHQRPHFFDVPNMTPVTVDNIPIPLKQREIDRFACFRITFVGNFTVAVDDMIATSLEFGCHRGFTGAGNTLDQIVSDTHNTTLQHSPASWRWCLYFRFGGHGL
ncbi:hypothetical protein D3C78_1466640 [compost metagenome]